VPITVVVVDADGAFADLLDEASNDEIVTIVCGTAPRGLNACCAIEPACVVIALELPDHEGQPRDGLWLVSALRDQPTAIASVPILMLTTDPSEETRMRILQGGVDIALGKPASVREVMTQVRSLVAMAKRLAERAGPAAPASTPLSSGLPRHLAGQLDHMPIATVLTLLEMNRASGSLLLTDGPVGAPALVLDLASGVLTRGHTDRALAPVEAMKLALRFATGRFRFVESASRPAPVGSSTIGQLVIAALRSDRSPTSLRGPASGLERAFGSESFATEKTLDPPTIPIGMPPAAAAPLATPPPAALPAAKPPPVRRTTLASQPAVHVPPAPKRRHSEMLRSAVKVETAPPARPSDPGVDGDRGDEPKR
jgi:DNA-binding response OmpR family regulator